MDNQQLFNLVVSIAGFLAMFIFYQVMQRLQKAEDAIEIDTSRKTPSEVLDELELMSRQRLGLPLT